jgi:hypothetical protein
VPPFGAWGESRIRSLEGQWSPESLLHVVVVGHSDGGIIRFDMAFLQEEAAIAK